MGGCLRSLFHLLDGGRVIVTPLLPASVGQLPIQPFRMIGLWGIWLLVRQAARAVLVDSVFAARLTIAKVFAAEMQAATIFAAIGFTATYIRQTAINRFVALWMVAVSRDAVANVSLPIVVEAKGSTHSPTSFMSSRRASLMSTAA